MKNKIYRRFATELYGDFGTELYKVFDKLNAKFFDNKLAERALLCGITPYGRTVGLYSSLNKSIMVHISYFSDFKGVTETRLKDVLLHEMMHANLDDMGATEKDSHGAKWADECNRVAPILGLTNVYFVTYYRTKKKSPNSERPKNIYKPAARFIPKGYRLASRNELKLFPSLTIARGFLNQLIEKKDPGSKISPPRLKNRKSTL